MTENDCDTNPEDYAGEPVDDGWGEQVERPGLVEAPEAEDAW